VDATSRMGGHVTWMGDVLPPRRPRWAELGHREKLDALALAAHIVGRLLNEIPRGATTAVVEAISDRIVEEETREASQDQKRLAAWFVSRVVESVEAREG
jgi:hypothetical protein